MASPARVAALDALLRVEKGADLDRALLGAALDRAGAEGPDRGLGTELCYGVLRWQRRLDHALDTASRRPVPELDPPVRAALRLGAYQLYFLDVPDHAALDATIGALKIRGGQRAAGYANAVLRKLSQTRPSPPSGDDPHAVAIACSHPDWLAERYIEALGASAARRRMEAQNNPAPLWLRVNRKRCDRESLQEKLREEGVETTVSELCPDALRVERGAGDPARLAAHRDGLFMIQDVAAQLVSWMLGDVEGQRVWDLCAAPGGKSTQLVERGARSVLALDVSARRMRQLRENQQRLGHPQMHIVRGNATRPPAPARSAGFVLLDAPCSALGLSRRHPELRWRRRPAELETLARRQRALLEGAAELVAPEGVLVYAVCSDMPEEGCNLIDAWLRSPAGERFEIVPPPMRVDTANPAWDAVCDASGRLQTAPDLHDADAFFGVRLRCLR